MRRFIGQSVLAVAAMAGFPLFALAGRNPQAQNGPQPSASPAPQSAMRAAGNDRGQQVFEQNCSRCHNPPDGFSPRISGAVALHMRVRANLSEQDYKALLHFLNP